MKSFQFALLIFGAAIVSAQAKSVVRLNETEWQLFKAQYGKTYEHPSAEALRQTIFAVNKQMIDQLNRMEDAESRGFTLALNHLADLTDSERQVLNGLRLPVEVESRRQVFVNSPEAQKFLDDILEDDTIEVPAEVDWRKTAGRVSAVKNQGQCGSCWAFATTGVLEGQEKTRSNLTGVEKVTGLSEQNLVDCDPVDQGCNGGLMKNALEFVQQENGIDDDVSYPYEAEGGTCRFNRRKVVMTDKGAAVLPMGDEEKLKQTVAKFGPVAVAIDASSMLFQFYHTGVYYDMFCGNAEGNLDHGVLVVGYGTDKTRGDYWIVKNSWGPEWGDKGYIKMSRNRKNNCGIATMATIPTF